MSPSRLFVRPVVAALAAVSLLSAGGAQADTTLLNVSYDVARELYKEINPAFVAHWQRTTGEKLTAASSWPTPRARWACIPGWPAPTPAGAS